MTQAPLHLPPQGERAHRSQTERHARTAASATRRSVPWTPLEDEELAACVSADDLEAFALRWKAHLPGRGATPAPPPASPSCSPVSPDWPWRCPNR